MASLVELTRDVEWLKKQIKCLKGSCGTSQTSTSSTSNQNNRIVNANLQSTQDLPTLKEQLVATINTTFGFTVTEDVNAIFTFTSFSGSETKQFLFVPGKGNYGQGFLAVTINDFVELLSSSNQTQNPEQILSLVSMSFKTKEGEQFKNDRLPTDLPQGETTYSTRNGFIAKSLPIVSAGQIQFNPGEGLSELSIRNLWLNIKNFDLIQDYQPKVVFTRYRHAKNKGEDNLTPGNNHYRKAGYRINNSTDPSIAPVRPAKVSITNANPIIDFGQEHYFSSGAILSNFFEGATTRGNSKHFKTEVGTGKNIPYIYFELKIEITVDSVNYMSEGLCRFRMELRPEGKILLRQV